MDESNTPSTNVGISQHGILLPGLDGGNPLAFLAALGLLQVVTNTQSQNRCYMRWLPLHSTWVPQLWIENDLTLSEDRLIDELYNQLTKTFSEHPVAVQLERLNTVPQKQRREIFCDVVMQCCSQNRVAADWLAALSSDAADAEKTSQLQTVRKDYFTGNLKSIIECAKPLHLSRSLFHPWDYADALDNQSLHWDPGEDRRHALQWNKPSGDPSRKKSGGMLGANRLALEALPLFALTPTNGHLQTTGFSGRRSNDTRWTWPIWNRWSTISNLRTLLCLSPLQDEWPDKTCHQNLRERGIVAAFRCKRILVGKTPNFTPAQQVA